ncbi:hypothetical protein E2P63_01205 [Candidatus Bathyarchaeota archaeon]|nr:hypothetical protein E2P63_01205 [Candidatus Bathyarchaeota archaeon]
MDILLIALATWRISSLVSAETGPFWIFSNFRAWIADKAKDGNKLFLTLEEGIQCIWCVSVWFSLIGALLLDGNYIVNVLAISALAILFDSILGKLNG